MNWECVYLEYINLEISYIQAIEELQKLGYSSHRAEEMVEQWSEGYEKD